MTSTFICPACGGKEFADASRSEPENNTPYTCTGCGAKITRNQFEHKPSKITEIAKHLSRDTFGDFTK